jgi:hypothetical protein
MTGFETSADVPARMPVAEIERRLADWKAHLPAHTISPGLMAELDALEEALHAARREEVTEEQRRPVGCCSDDCERS